MDKQIDLLRAAEQTLEKITVSGAENLDRLLGCILTLRSVTAALEAMKKEESNASQYETERDPVQTGTDGICRY